MVVYSALMVNYNIIFGTYGECSGGKKNLPGFALWISKKISSLMVQNIQNNGAKISVDFIHTLYIIGFKLSIIIQQILFRNLKFVFYSIFLIIC